MIIDPVWNNPLVWVAGITGLFNTIQSILSSRKITTNHDETTANLNKVKEAIKETKSDSNSN